MRHLVFVLAIKRHPKLALAFCMKSPGLCVAPDLGDLQQRLAFRPPLTELFHPSAQNMSKEERNNRIRKAHLDNGYSLAAIARHLGLHYSTISRILNEKPSAEHI